MAGSRRTGPLRAGTLYAPRPAPVRRPGGAGPRGGRRGRLRRYYRITRDGAAALSPEVDRLRRRAEVAARRLAALRPAAANASPV
ncbi:hypothetical protein [Thermomonospora umbrina]|uniref:hypothetical protein n=1 Tax=Thermomonospora umbrina TaxID=111806 RepID=UPI001FE53C86|nr:hypothetical protein [Thermomonospora umbrina]